MSDRELTNTVTQCAGCDADIATLPPENESEPCFCFECLKLPAVLRKALTDQPFDYACRLTTGEVIRFGAVSISHMHREWITLDDIVDANGGEFAPSVKTIPYPCPRGLDVRLDQIVWLADAPQGS